MQTKPRRHSIDTLFVFLLLLLFALFSLVLAGMGAAVYRSGVAHLNENYTSRTAIAYVSEKVRQHDESGAVFASDVEGIPALALRETTGSGSYLTYIYYYEGSLRELFVREETVPAAAMGSSLVELSDFSVDFTSDVGKSGDQALLTVTAVSPDGTSMSLLIHPDSQ
jgi:hypothetical protein